MQIAILLYPGTTALDVVGPYELLSRLPGADVRFVGKEAGPLLTDGGALLLGVTHTLAETPASDLVLVPRRERASRARLRVGSEARALGPTHQTGPRHVAAPGPDTVRRIPHPDPASPVLG